MKDEGADPCEVIPGNLLQCWQVIASGFDLAASFRALPYDLRQ